MQFVSSQPVAVVTLEDSGGQASNPVTTPHFRIARQ